MLHQAVESDTIIACCNRLIFLLLSITLFTIPINAASITTPTYQQSTSTTVSPENLLLNLPRFLASQTSNSTVYSNTIIDSKSEQCSPMNCPFNCCDSSNQCAATSEECYFYKCEPFMCGGVDSNNGYCAKNVCVDTSDTILVIIRVISIAISASLSILVIAFSDRIELFFKSLNIVPYDLKSNNNTAASLTTHLNLGLPSGVSALRQKQHQQAQKNKSSKHTLGTKYEEEELEPDQSQLVFQKHLSKQRSQQTGIAGGIATAFDISLNPAVSAGCVALVAEAAAAAASVPHVSNNKQQGTQNANAINYMFQDNVMEDEDRIEGSNNNIESIGIPATRSQQQSSANAFITHSKNNVLTKEEEDDANDSCNLINSIVLDRKNSRKSSNSNNPTRAALNSRLATAATVGFIDPAINTNTNTMAITALKIPAAGVAQLYKSKFAEQ